MRGVLEIEAFGAPVFDAETQTRPLSTATPKRAMKPTPAEIENGMPRKARAKTPPVVANGTAS